jgi:hypothetical protein
MKRSMILAAVAALSVSVAAFATTSQAAHPQAAARSIQIVAPSGPLTVGMHGKISVSVKINGVTLDPKAIGKAPVAGRGHFHFYVDCIPSDAYVKADIATCYAAAAATSKATFDLSKSAVKITKGTHVLLVALANNNHVLYRAPASAVLFTVH